MNLIKSKDLKKVLLKLGIKKNSSCFIHCSIINLGVFEDKKIENIPKNLFKILKNITGPYGTISTLSANYEYGNNNKIFDLSKSLPTHEIGDFSKFFVKKKKSTRSINPIFNITAIGKKSKYITSSINPTSFGEDSSWDRLFKLNSDIVFLGCDLNVCTFIRFIEFRYGVPYLYNKFFETKIRKNGKTLSNFSCSPLRYKGSISNYNLEKFQNILIKKKVLKVIKNKNFSIMSMKMQPCFKIGIELLKRDIHFFLKSKPKYKKTYSPYR